MNSILLAGIVTCLAVLGAAFAVLRKYVGSRTLSREQARDEDESEAPIEKRLTVDDYKFLFAHPVLARAFARELRRERRKVLRHYIRRLRCDFDQVCAEMKLMMTQSCQDRSDLATMLLKERLLFTVVAIRAEFDDDG